MDPFWRVVTTDTGSEWDSYLHDIDNESERCSSDDDIGEIEEALLRRIHYAEDCDEDLSSAPKGGTRGPLVHHTGDRVAQITFASLDLNSERTTDDTTKTGLGSYVEGEIRTSVKTEKCLEPATNSLLAIPDKMAPSESRGPDWDAHGSDSEIDSKYKAIKSNKTSGATARDDSDSVIEISSSSDGTRESTASYGKRKNSVRSNDDVVSVNCTETDLKEGSIPKEPELSVPTKTKRQWRKSKDDPEIPVQTTKKLKLKRTVIDAELRTVLDEAKGISSEDDFGDAMLIESLSEDEALDVNYESTPTGGRGYNQDQFSERRRSRGRYYQEPDNWPRYKCYNCMEFGHMGRDCPQPRRRKLLTCVLCGTQGHSDRQCPDALCYICDEPGHQSWECPNKKLQYLTCRRCSIKGHTERQCPDRWRQYHLTTEPGKIQCDESRKENQKLVAANGKVFCYNCSKEGHFGHECWEEPMDRHVRLILPYVVRYDYIPRRFWKVQMDMKEPPQNTRGFDDRGPDDGLDGTAPSIPPKKERRKTRLKRLRAEKLAAAATAVSQDKQTKDPTTSKKKEKKGKKRKLEQAELIVVDSKDDVEDQVVKRCRKKNKEELEADEKLREELATLPKAERRRINRKKGTQSKRDSLTREEILTDYEETEEYVRKAGHMLRKRNDAVRRAIALELTQPRVETQTPPISGKKKKKKKKPGQSKSERKAWMVQHKFEQQQVSFKPNFEEFPELERRFLEQDQSSPQQLLHPEVALDSASAAHSIHQSTGGGAKKNRRKAKQKSNDGARSFRHTNLQGINPRLNTTMPPDQSSTNPLSKKQKKREFFKRQDLQKRRGSWADRPGFKKEPKY